MNFILFLSLCFFIPFLLIIGIAFAASFSRNSKRRKLQSALPDDVEYQALVRLNSVKTHRKFWKFKGFEFSGLIYVAGNRITIAGTKSQLITYNLPSVVIKWEGVNAKSGLIEWFSLSENGAESYYVNGETGTFIFSLNKKKYQTTSQIYSTLLNMQQLSKMPPPSPAL